MRTRIVVPDQFIQSKRLSETSQVESVSKRMKILDQFMEMTETTQLTETLSAETLRNPLIVEQILSHLPPSDMKSVARVCRMWRTVVDHPRYWTWAKVQLSNHNFEEIFPTRRFRK